MLFALNEQISAEQVAAGLDYSDYLPDNQAQAVYASDHAAHLNAASPWPPLESLEACRDFLAKLTQCPTYKALGPEGITLHDPGDALPCPAYDDETNRVLLPGGRGEAWMIVHEVAHAIQAFQHDMKTVEFHGAEFCGYELQLHKEIGLYPKELEEEYRLQDVVYLSVDSFQC